MAGSIKLFQFVQKFHRFIGIYPREPNQKHSTNWTQATCLISYAQYLCTTSAFLLFEANSLFDFGFVFFTLAAVVNCIAIYLIFIWQSQNTYEFIENCERFIEKSELTSSLKEWRIWALYWIEFGWESKKHAVT